MIAGNATSVGSPAVQGAASRLRIWLKGQAAKGRFRRAVAFRRRCVDLYRFHPRERFLNRLTVQYNTLTGVWKRLPFRREIIRRIFYVRLQESPTGRIVVKVPRGDNQYSCRFLQAIRSPAGFEAYQRVLTSLRADPWLAPHCLEVQNIRRDGGYSSEYIEGYNLAELRMQLFDSSSLPASLRQGLIEALNEILGNLRGYVEEHGNLVGDWPLHNLVFCPVRNRIFNVDAEGFFTFESPSCENQLPFIESSLMDMVTFLRLLDSESPEDSKTVSVLKLIDKVRQSGKTYSGLHFLVGYHSLALQGRVFRGQRECAARLATVPYDFKDKVVVDLGCNVGGMLHYLSPTIRKGVGFDVNPHCVNAANAVKALNKSRNLDFYNFDLDRDDLLMLPSYLLNERADICFLLSICMWLKEWRTVVYHAAKLADTMLFESNGTAEQQAEQLAVLNKYFGKCHLISDSSADDPLQKARRLYLCTENLLAPEKRPPAPNRPAAPGQAVLSHYR